MPITGHGERRYPKRRAQALPRTIVDGKDLGPAMRPQDIFLWLRQLLCLEPAEVVEAMRLGAAALEARPEIASELAPGDRELAVRQALEATPSRVDAWRRRAREMTWLELRVLLAGLREVEMGDAP